MAAWIRSGCAQSVAACCMTGFGAQNCVASWMPPALGWRHSAPRSCAALAK